jgi:hypothetical protein
VELPIVVAPERRSDGGGSGIVTKAASRCALESSAKFSPIFQLHRQQFHTFLTTHSLTHSLTHSFIDIQLWSSFVHSLRKSRMILEHAVKTSNVLAVRDILRTASLEAMDETDFVSALFVWLFGCLFVCCTIEYSVIVMHVEVVVVVFVVIVTCTPSTCVYACVYVCE